ncbi:MAG: hypothetical protein ABI389_08390 [Rhodanobacter sp.]
MAHADILTASCVAARLSKIHLDFRMAVLTMRWRWRTKWWRRSPCGSS